MRTERQSELSKRIVEDAYNHYVDYSMQWRDALAEHTGCAEFAELSRIGHDQIGLAGARYARVYVEQKRFR